MTRKPQQKRAISTVDAIIQAGIIVLATEGEKGLTTRKVADVAGVSVGSLYEYFENKKAIHAAIIDSLANDLADAVRAEIPNIVQLSIGDAVRSILNLVKEKLEKDDQRLLHCVRHSLSHLRNYPFKPLQRVLSELSIRYLMHHPKLAQVKNLPTTSYIIIYGGMYTVLHHMSDPNPPMSFDELVDGLVAMVTSYIEGNLASAQAGI